MKKTFLLFALLCAVTMTHALTINNTAGNLATAVGAELTTCTSLTVTGNIDARDFKTMRFSMPALTTIDLSGATVVEYIAMDEYDTSTGEAGITYAADILPNYAFDGNTMLTSIVLPNTILAIEKNAFADCSGLTSITIPNTVKTIGSQAFFNCRGLTSVVIPNSVISIGDFAFIMCKGLEFVTIPNSVKTIGESAFAQCYNLKSIDIPNSVTTISDNTFGECISLTSVTIPNSVTTINSNAFSFCSSLTSVTIPASVAVIGEYAFLRNSGTINVDAANPNYSSRDGMLFNKAQTTLIHCPISMSNSYAIPNSVISIEELAFYGCSNLTSIHIHNSVSTIGYGSFADCSGYITVDEANTNYSSLNGVLFNKNQTTLVQCPTSKAGNYSIPNTVTEINSDGFYNCKKITSVVIPNQVKFIGEYAFDSCIGLNSIIVINPTPSAITLESDIFYDINKTTCVLYVPAESIELYKAADQWKDFTTIREYIPTAVSPSTATSTNISITANRLSISNAPKGESVMVYNINGTLISTQKATGSVIEVVLPEHGMYIVKVNEKSEKIIY